MTRRIGTFLIAAALTFAALSQIAEEYRTPYWGLYTLLACAGVGFIAAMTLGGGKKQPQVVAKPLSWDADRLRSFLATFSGESFTEEELRARESLRGVNLTAAITELGGQLVKGNRAGATTYKLKQ